MPDRFTLGKRVFTYAVHATGTAPTAFPMPPSRSGTHAQEASQQAKVGDACPSHLFVRLDLPVHLVLAGVVLVGRAGDHELCSGDLRPVRSTAHTRVAKMGMDADQAGGVDLQLRTERARGESN